MKDWERIIYKIGQSYKYPEHDASKIYILERVDRWVFIFKCGHCVTDSIFEDLIDLSTGKSSWQHAVQLQLF